MQKLKLLVTATDLKYDKKTKSTRLVQATHLYNKESKKSVKIEQGHLREYKFKDLYLPSAVYDQYYDTDVKGNKLPYSSRMYNVLGTIPNKQATSIIRFAKHKHFDKPKKQKKKPLQAFKALDNG